MAEGRGHEPWLGGEGHWNFKVDQESFPELEQKVHQTMQTFKDQMSPISRKQQKPPTEKSFHSNKQFDQLSS